MATACILLYISANQVLDTSLSLNPPNPMSLSANWNGMSSNQDKAMVDQGVKQEIKEEVLHMEAEEAVSTGHSLIILPAPEVI
jgi:hypothetical protein